MLAISVTTSISIYKAIDAEEAKLLKEFRSFISSDEMTSALCKNISLLMSIPGIGYITALKILAEIGGIDIFLNPKQLITFISTYSNIFLMF